MDPIKFLAGYKTYAAAVALVGLGIYQIFGEKKYDEGLRSIFEGLAIIFGRQALNKATGV